MKPTIICFIKFLMLENPSLKLLLCHFLALFTNVHFLEHSIGELFDKMVKIVCFYLNYFSSLILYFHDCLFRLLSPKIFENGPTHD